MFTEEELTECWVIGVRAKYEQMKFLQYQRELEAPVSVSEGRVFKKWYDGIKKASEEA